MNIISTYNNAIKNLATVWPILAFIFFVNCLFGYVFISPLKASLDETIGKSLFAERLGQGFDYTALTEILRETGGLSGLSSWLIGLALLYFLWNIFTSAGFLGILGPHSKLSIWNKFYQAGSKYFLSILTITFFSIFLFSLGLLAVGVILQALGLNLLQMETELALIRNIKLAVVFLFVWRFLIGIFRDHCKLDVIDNGLAFWSMIKNACKHFLSSHYILLAFFNVAILALFLILLFFLKSSLGEFVLFGTIGLLGQLSIFLRVVYRYIRINSFHALKQSKLSHDIENED